MSNSSRPAIVAGNWKMYKTIEESVAYIESLAPLVKESLTQIYLAVPFTALKSTAEKAKDTNIVVGAQNMNDATEGAFTGEIAGRMLKDAGAEFVILGHSERRHIFHETDEFVNKKVKRALKDGLKIILCIGETQTERQNGQTQNVLERQLNQSLAEITKEELDHIILAYEPVWAIGTNLTATPEVAQEAHHFCREQVSKVWGEEAAEKIIIQYGGSVKAENAKVLMDQSDIDGLLVGGASLSPETFSKIVNFQNL